MAMYSNNTSSGIETCEMMINCNIQEDMIKLIDTGLFSIIFLMIILGNSLVMRCYYKFRTLRNITNTFIMSLSMSDMLVATLSIPYSYLVLVCDLIPCNEKRTLKDFIYLTCDMVPSLASIYSLTFIAIERAFVILFPYKHNIYASKQRAWLVVLMIWVFVVVVVCVNFFVTKLQFTLLIILIGFSIPVALMLISYSIMGYVAKKHADKMRKLNGNTYHLQHLSPHYENSISLNSLKNSKENAVDSQVLNRSCQRQNLIPKVKRISVSEKIVHTFGAEFKAALTLSLILSCFVFTWMPFIGLNIKYYICNEEKSCVFEIKPIIVKYFKILHYMNSAVNPILFALLNKQWRAAFKVILGKHKPASDITRSFISDFNGW